MSIILFDDETHENLKPLTLNKLVSALRIGIFTIEEKWNKYLNDLSVTINSSFLPDAQLVQKIKDLKEEIKLLDEKEESNYIKVQFLHNTYGCRIDLTRQEKKSKSLKSDTHTYGGTLGFDGTVGSQPYTYSKTYIKKTYKGEKLVPHYVYHGKIISKSLEKSKTCYWFRS